MPPLFSIGVPTYSRRGSLKQTLLSIVAQTFTDFEVIVGNDCPGETLSGALLEIDDPRIRFVNNPKNLGERANMNALLGLARGKYFTWQFDDDLYAPNFLQAVRGALLKFNFPSCVFTSYTLIRENSLAHHEDNPSGQEQFLSGRHFLRLYLCGRLKAMGCTGVYETGYIRRIGGVQQLTDGPFALFSEYSLLLKSGLLERVAYIDAPLVYYRAHQGSWGTTTLEVSEYKQAGKSLVKEAFEILRTPPLREDFNQNFSSILRFALREYVARSSMRSGIPSLHEAQEFLSSLKSWLVQHNETDLAEVEFPGFWKAMGWFAMPFLVGKFKATAPRPIVKLAYKAHSVLRRDRFFRFK